TKSVTSPAQANVPSTPSVAIGVAAARNRRSPIEAPPWNRITISATVAIRSTVAIRGTRDGNTSEATAAATRNSAAEGSDRRAPSFVARRAAARAAATSRMGRPKLVRSCTVDRRYLAANGLENSLQLPHERHNRDGNTCLDAPALHHPARMPGFRARRPRGERPGGRRRARVERRLRQ